MLHSAARAGGRRAAYEWPIHAPLRGGAESTPCWCTAATDDTHGIETQEVATSRSVLRCARKRVSVRLSALIGMAISMPQRTFFGSQDVWLTPQKRKGKKADGG